MKFLPLVRKAWTELSLPTIGAIGPWIDPAGVLPFLFGALFTLATIVAAFILTVKTRRAFVWTPTIFLVLGIAGFVWPKGWLGWAFLLILWSVVAWPRKARPESREPRHSLARAALLLAKVLGASLVVSVVFLFVALIFLVISV